MFCRILMAATLGALPLQNAAAETYALVVGADQYPYESSLDGAVKDAEDVAAALGQAGITQIAKFIDADVTKVAIRDAWTDFVERASKDDTIIFTYAGHGSQMPELVAGDEDDGLDEFLQLPGFDRDRAEETDHEIIVDNELNAWFAEAEAKGIRVLFVSDSCHSGGMSRSFSGKTRLAPAVTVKLSAPSEEAMSGAKLRERDFRDVTVLAASLESQPTPEVIINGEPRGALSWSFARALEGAGDRNGDGMISRLELEDYVFSNVKNQSEALQVPNFTPQIPRSQDEVVVSLSRSLIRPTETAPGTGTGTGQANGLKSARDLGWTDKLALSVSGSTIAIANIGGAGVPYRWDAAAGNFYTPNGDLAGQAITEARVQGVVDKFVLLDFLKAMASQKAGTVSLTPLKDLYRSGDRLTFAAPASGYSSRVVFNLANTGEVQLIDVQSAASEAAFKLPDLEVVRPFGADHLVVIATNEPVDAIAAVLASPSIDAATLLQVLQTRIDASDSSIAIQPLYTQERP
ncbi:caspase family protein [Pararhizobium antarcticum]|uniref:Peptidase C14 caspase domain-containing protein n=1 Tax=Pararhizobium antarcticum TaxID=1798805 RepID=A0A657LLY7_9HYPH|nr:caspase family protein [Pararhizobium antarcticum]OJF90002.1 hypothetical protein AX760_08725 [Pararhizobium antarcticum]OJF93166.1 hypothetical protein AX761_04870 [Rhizobium sp. 58]